MQTASSGEDRAKETPISHGDVTTIMGLIVDIRDDVGKIVRLLEDEDEDQHAGAA